MSTEVNRSQTPTASNSGNVVRGDMQPPNSQQRKYQYELEDFDQSIINRHQQYINYELVEVNKKTVRVLTALRDVVAGLPGPPAGVDAIQALIDEVYNINEKVAGWYPPGCRSGGNAGGEGTGEGGDTGTTITTPTPS